MKISPSLLLALVSAVAALPTSDISKPEPAAKLFKRENCGYGERRCHLWTQHSNGSLDKGILGFETGPTTTNFGGGFDTKTYTEFSCPIVVDRVGCTNGWTLTSTQCAGRPITKFICEPWKKQ